MTEPTPLDDPNTRAPIPPEDPRASAPIPPDAAGDAPAVEAIPPDPVEYDSERNVAARARGLDAPYIPGGRDPDPEPARREERFYLRLLIGMVIAIVLAGFLLGIVGNLVGAAVR
jgi:hypothetical protein